MSTTVEQWPVWFRASAVDKFSVALAASGVHVHVEGETRETQDKAEWFEVRVDGPVFKEGSKGIWRVDLEVNIACCVTTGGGKSNYRLDQLVGKASAAFGVLSVYKYGPSDDPANDESYVCCMKLKTGDREKLQIAHFGVLRPDTEMVQASVEGHYDTYLTE